MSGFTVRGILYLGRVYNNDEDADHSEKAIDQQPEPKLEMWLEVIGHTLYIKVTDCDSYIGTIDAGGSCRILNLSFQIKHYQQWRNSGMHVREQEPVEWRGGEYELDTDCYDVVWLQRICGGGRIYDFTRCYYASNCQDDNIQRHEYNNRPIGF